MKRTRNRERDCPLNDPWILGGFQMDSERIPGGFLNGFQADSSWISQRILDGFLMDSRWIPRLIHTQRKITEGGPKMITGWELSHTLRA